MPTRAPAVVEQRILESAARLRGSDGVVTGWAALRWYGAAYFDGTSHDGTSLPVELAISTGGHGTNLRPIPGTVVSRRYISRRERTTIDGLRVATVQRALYDEIVRRGTLTGGVIAIDMTAAAGLISAWLFAIYAGDCNSLTGAPLVRSAAALAVDESRSPRESWLRMVWREAGLPTPLVNPRVYDRHGRFLAMPDLLEPEAGFVAEYDGAHHLKTRRKDLDREARLRDHGLEYVTIVGGQTRRQVADALLGTARRAHTWRRDQNWTVEPPAGVVAPETLDERLERLGLAPGLTVAGWIPSPPINLPSLGVDNRAGAPRGG